MTTWQIPEPLAVGWQMRTLDSAKISARSLDDGRFRQTVEHAPLPGVTPAMCLWYLEHVDPPAHLARAHRAGLPLLASARPHILPAARAVRPRRPMAHRRGVRLRPALPSRPDVPCHPA